MSMEVNSILRDASHVSPAHLRSADRAGMRATQRPEPSVMVPDVDLEQLLSELQSVTQVFNRRLQFSVNRELDQMVVKVIDKTTDTVIKEIPPAEMQRVHMRIREAIGLFIDERM